MQGFPQQGVQATALPQGFAPQPMYTSVAAVQTANANPMVSYASPMISYADYSISSSQQQSSNLGMASPVIMPGKPGMPGMAMPASGYCGAAVAVQPGVYGLTPPVGLQMIPQQLTPPIGVAVGGLAPRQNGHSGPFQFYAIPPVEAEAASPAGATSGNGVLIPSPTGSMAAGSPTAADPLTMPTAMHLGVASPNSELFMPSPTGSMAAGSTTVSVAGSLPTTTQNLSVPNTGASLALPTETEYLPGSWTSSMSQHKNPLDSLYVSGGSYPVDALATEYYVPVPTQDTLPESSVAAMGTVLAPGIASPSQVSALSPTAAAVLSPFASASAAHALPATAPAGLGPPTQTSQVPLMKSFPTPLTVGSIATIKGLDNLPSAANINGQVCTLISYDAPKDKWVVRMPDNTKARVPVAALSLA